MKLFWQSKLFWLGITEIAIGVLQYVSGQLSAGGAITSMGIITILLRFVTSKAITLK